jgi:hypothetical protein
MRGVATQSTKQYGEYRLSNINDSGESTKTFEIFLEFKAKFEKPSGTEKVAWEEPIPEKSEAKNLFGLSL